MFRLVPDHTSDYAFPFGADDRVLSYECTLSYRLLIKEHHLMWAGTKPDIREAS